MQYSALCNIVHIIQLIGRTTLVVSIPCTIVYIMQHEKFSPFQKIVAIRLTSEQVVSMMYTLSGNNTPSDSNDERLNSGDGETVTDELDQLSTIITFALYLLLHYVHNSAHIV